MNKYLHLIVSIEDAVLLLKIHLIYYQMTLIKRNLAITRLYQHAINVLKIVELVILVLIVLNVSQILISKLLIFFFKINFINIF